MSGKTAVARWSSVMTALTVLALFAMTTLHLTGWSAALAWVPALAAMAGMITVTVRTAGQSGSC